MDVAYNVRGHAPTDEREPHPNGPLRVLRQVLLPLSLVLWAIGVYQTNGADLGQYGLLSALSPIFYVGLALLVVSAGIEFSRSSLSQVRLALHAISLVVILYGTAALVYAEGRYSWLYKTIGVIKYVDVNGSLNRSIDIYQNWPGFFALASWFDKVSGVDPLSYAKWAQLVLELAAIPLLYTIYQSMSLPVWHRWLAIMLYAASNWIGQDYLSPQGISTVLSLGIMAVLTRWMFVVKSGRRGPVSPREFGGARRRDPVVMELRRSGPFLIVLVFLFFVLTATHELSPYIIAIQVAALAVTGLARPRWVALLLALIAVGYLAPNFTYVNDHYGITASVGSFFSNVQPPSSATSGVASPQSEKIIADCARLLCVSIWLLAVVGAWLRRKSRRIVLALVLLTFSPFLVLLGGSYGNEGLFRVYLFSLPWAVTLGACALAPLRRRAEGAGHSALRVVIPLTLALTLFLVAFFGNDASDAMTSSEVNTIVKFTQSTKPGPFLAVIADAPASDVSNYNEFPVGNLLGSGGIVPANQSGSDMAAYVARTMNKYFPNEPVYILMSPSMIAYNNEYGQAQPSLITTLMAELAKSPYWKLAANDNHGTEIYQLSPAVRTIPKGPYGVYPNLVVP